MKFSSVQVTYAQGLVKTFIIDEDVTVLKFIETAKAFGRIRSVRFNNEVDAPTAALLIETGNAARVRSKHGEEKTTP